jgi:hypothetical protein
VTLGKFHQLKETTLPSLLNTASETLDADLDNDKETLLQVIDNMDQLVFEEFIKKKSRGLEDVMENGILRGGVDWLNAGKPTGESCFTGEASEVAADLRGEELFCAVEVYQALSIETQKGRKEIKELMTRGPTIYAQNDPYAR